MDATIEQAEKIVRQYQYVAPSLLMRKLSIGIEEAREIFDLLIKSKVIAKSAKPHLFKVLAARDK